MAKVASLLVDFQVQSAQLRKGLDQANGHLQGFQKQFQAVSSVLAGSFAFAVGKRALVGLASFVKEGAEAADKMTKLAAATGVPVDALSRLDYAASFAGVSTEDLATSMGKLNKTMGDALAGKTEQAQLFKALGMDILDTSGKMKSANVVMGEVADLFAQMEDGAGKAALAQLIFGKSGAKMIPLLNGGSEGMKKAAAEADAFGLTIGSVAGAQAEKFNDSLARLGKMVDGLQISVAAQLAPAITGLAEGLSGAAQKGELMQTISGNIAKAFKFVAAAGVQVVSTIGAMADILEGLLGVSVAMMFGDVTAAGKHIDAAMVKIEARSDLAKEAVQAIWAPIPTAAENAARAAKKSAEEILKALEKKAKNASLEAFKAIKKEADALEAKLATFGMDATATLLWRILSGDLSLEIKKAGKAGADQAERLLAIQKKLQAAEKAAAEKKEAAAFFKSVEASLDETFTTAMDKWNDDQASLFKDVTGDLADTFEKAARDWEQTQKDTATALLDSWKATQDQAQAVREGAAGAALSGGVGKAVDLAQTGAGAAGAAGVLAKLLADSKAFQLLGETVASLLQLFSDILDPISKALIPVVNVFGNVFKVLVPAFTALFKMVMTILTPIQMLIQVALPPFFEVFKWLGIGLMNITSGIGSIWNGIVGAVQGLLNWLAGLDLFGWKPLAFLGDVAAAMEDVKAQTDFNLEIATLSAMTFDDATESIVANSDATDENTEKVEDTTEAFQKLVESLTNVPRGFRVAAARYAAQGSGDLATFGGASALDKFTGGISLEVKLDSQVLATAVNRRNHAGEFLKTGRYGHGGKK